MQPLPAPVAVHLGYRKTGSTWLQNVALQRHPSVASVPSYPLSPGLLVKDPFLRELIVTPDVTFDPGAARELLIDAIDRATGGTPGLVVISAERLSGHGSSGGYDVYRIAHRLHSVIPEARVFWVLRDQPSAIRAEYKQLVKEGWTGRVEATLASRPSWRTVGFDLRQWEYHHLVEVYRGLFGEQSVEVFDYRALRRDSDDFLRRLARFLDLEPWPTLDKAESRRVNVSKPDEYVAARRLLNHVKRSDLHPYPAVAFPHRLRAGMVRVVARLMRGPLFPPDFDQRMADRYRASNLRLRELTGIDFVSEA